LRTSALLLACLSGGCSVVFVTPPAAKSAPGFARPHVDCTSSYLWPIVDSALTAYELAGVAYVSTLDDARFRNYPISRQGDMAVGAAFAAAFAGSAIYGYVSAARCRRVRNGPPPQDYLPGVSSAPGPEGDVAAPFSRHRSRRRSAAAALP
jgi:hypothetical protein